MQVVRDGDWITVDGIWEPYLLNNLRLDQEKEER